MNTTTVRRVIAVLLSLCLAGASLTALAEDAPKKDKPAVSKEKKEGDSDADKQEPKAKQKPKAPAKKKPTEATDDVEE